jgi:hypothetical protein
MGIFDWFKDDEEDRSLIEISNDAGDHWVADVPTDGVKETERALRDAGVKEDNDDLISKIFGASRIADKRDSEESRYRSDRVVDEEEDLEAEQDDDSLTERDEQPAEGGWLSWWK